MSQYTHRVGAADPDVDSLASRIGPLDHRLRGRDAQTENIQAGIAVAESVRSTLGPKGMDKLLFRQSEGQLLVTNDGATILSEMEIAHPAAERLVEVATGQEETVGDGTTSAVVLAGSLLREAERLLDAGVHPSAVSRGFHLSGERAREVLAERAMPVDADSSELLQNVARTAITGKWSEGQKATLAALIVDAVQAVARDGRVDLDDVYVGTAHGDPTDSTLVRGLVIDLGRSSSTLSEFDDALPERVEDVTVALVDEEISAEKAKGASHYTVDSYDAHRRILDHEDDRFRGFVERFQSLGVDVLFCQKSVSDALKSRLARAGIYAVERTRQDEMFALARLTGGELVFSVDELTDADLGRAARVDYEAAGGTALLSVVGEGGPTPVSLVLRAGIEHVREELDRIVMDGLRVVESAVESGRVLPGGGAPQMAMSLAVADYAPSVGGREQLAVEAFADAVTAVPHVLAGNAGLDPLDSVLDLRVHHHDGEHAAGLDADSGAVVDMLELGVVGPLSVAQRAVASAVEAANLIVRIDDVLVAADEGDDHDDHAGHQHGGADTPPWMLGH